jgi:galactokinase
MSSDVPLSEATQPPFDPESAFVAAPDQFDDYQAPGRASLRERARDVLVDRLGPADAPPATAYACGTIGVQADQTHYSDGFGLLMPLQQGVAVAARRADATRVVVGGGEETWDEEDSDPPPWITVVQRVMQELLAEQRVEVAVAGTVPGTCRDGYLAALAVALMRVVRRLGVPPTVDLDHVESLRDVLVPLLAGEIGTALDQPYSTAYLLATFAGDDPAFTLVDTSTREHLPVETEARSALQWALLDPGGPTPRPGAFHRRRRQQAEQALHHLRANGFAGLEAFRDLEHRDLERAITALPEELGPVVRHLVTENRRVQKHVAAMRRSDWQMIGALLLMSHASQRDDWEGTSDAADAVVAEAESRTHDGLYGACMTGRSGAVLVTGRPSAFGEKLGRLADALESVLGHPPRILRP